MSPNLTGFALTATILTMNPEMTWEYCMEKAFDIMHSGSAAETAKAKVESWVTIARELRHSDEALQSQIQKIVAEAKPV